MDPQQSFQKDTFCPNMDCPARGHTHRGNIRIHCHGRGRLRCTLCGKTFSERHGTPFHHAPTPPETITLVMTLVAYGCPIAAIEAAFGFQRRTVRAWLQKAGVHCQGVHEALVLQPQVLGHVQVDELFVRRQQADGQAASRWFYLFSALCVLSRLWLGGTVALERSEAAARSLAEQVRRAALPGPLVVVFDGLRAYRKAFLRTFRFSLRTGRPGRPRLVVFSELVLLQHVKQSQVVHLIGGTWMNFLKLWRRVGTRTVSTSYIERLNATFRERLAMLTRRTRHLARTAHTLEAGLSLMGSVYSFCQVHQSLGQQVRRTPAMAAGLTDEVWSVERLLRYRVAPPRWRPPRHRGPLSKREQMLLQQWGAP